MREVILDEKVNADLVNVKKLIRDYTGNNSPVTVSKLVKGRSFYDVVRTSLSDGTRNTPEQINYLEVYEKALSVFRESALELRTAMDVLTLEQRLGAKVELVKQRGVDADDSKGELEQEITDSLFLSNRYSLYFAGQIGLALLGSQKAPVANLYSFGTQNDPSKDRDKLTGLLAGIASEDLLRIATGKEKADDSDLKYTLEAIFTSWINQFDWKTFEGTARKRNVTDLTLRYGNFSLTGGEFKQKYDVVEVDDRIMNVRKEEVIGGQEFGQVLWNNMIKLSAYNHGRKKNPFSPPGVIFTYGEPGGGKTFNAHAYMRSFAELCKTKGVPLWVMTHSTTDYASHYQNKTANELSALADKIKAFPGPVVMYVADADNIFQSRKDPSATTEQKSTMSVYFKMFDGQLVPKNGKFMAIMDANYIDGIDDATKSRVFDEIVELKRFDKPEQFAELARRSISKGIEGKLLTDDEWLEVGKFLINSSLSNREVGHVIGKLRRGFVVPETMVGASNEECEKLNAQHVASLTKGVILTGFENYINTRMEMERASNEAKNRADYERFAKALSGQGKDTLTGGA